MKKYNAKQEAYSRKKVRESMLKMFGWFVFALVMIFVIPTAVSAINNPADVVVMPGIISSGIILLVMSDIGNQSAPGLKDTAPNQIGFRLWLAAVDQIDPNQTFPTPNAARQLGNIPLLSGQYWHHFDGVENSIKYTSTAEKGEITGTFDKTIPIIVDYNVNTLNFVESYAGKGFCLVYKECEDATLYEVGSYCKPIYLRNVEVKNDGDGKYILLTFGNTHWRQPLIYTGSVSEQAATTIAADATTLALVSGQSAYTLSDGSAATVTFTAISGVGSSDYGKYITVSAPAAADYPPDIDDSAVFVLVDGATWTANPGSSITFMILDDSTLVEISRVQTT